MKYLIMVFILVVAVIIIAGHAALYFSWLKFYGITSMDFKRTLAIIMAGLSLSFVVTTLLVHWHENFLFNSLYYLAGAWLGTVWYVSLAMAGTWVIWLIIRLAGGTLPIKTVSSILIGLAVVFSLYGLWNAMHPRLKHVTVRIENLPAAWRGRTVVQLSDVHLGAVHRSGFMRRVVSQVASVKPDVVFITGDLFDGAGTELDRLADPLKELSMPHGMYYITGNHETYVGLERSLNALKSLPLKVLRDEIVTVDGVQIAGFDYPLPGKKSDPAPLLSRLDPAMPTIVLYHEPVVSFIKQVQAAGADLMLAGHTHRGQMWPFGYITRKVYQGFDFGLRTEGKFSIYTSPGVGTWGPAMRTGNRPEIVVLHFQ